MDVRQCMKPDVVSIPASATVGEAAALAVERHVGTLPVVDQNNNLVGILHIRDLLKLVMPAFVSLIEDFDFVRGHFGDYETLRPSPEMAAQPVRPLMEEAVSVGVNSGLLRAFALMDRHDLYDLPVLDNDGRLVGIASRVDIGTALLAGWTNN